MSARASDRQYGLTRRQGQGTLANLRVGKDAPGDTITMTLRRLVQLPDRALANFSAARVSRWESRPTAGVIFGHSAWADTGWSHRRVARDCAWRTVAVLDPRTEATSSGACN